VKQSWELTAVGRNDLNFPLLSSMWHIYQEYNTQRCRDAFPQCCKRDGRSGKWKQEDMWNMYSILVGTGPLRLLLALHRTLLIYSGTIYSTKMSKQHEIYLSARPVNSILFIFRHPSKCCLTVDKWNTYVYMCVEQKKAYRTECCGPVGSAPLLYYWGPCFILGPELAILSEPVLIFLIIQVKTVVVSQDRPRPLPSTSSQVTLPFEVVCCELPKASIN